MWCPLPMLSEEKELRKRAVFADPCMLEVEQEVGREEGRR